MATIELDPEDVREAPMEPIPSESAAPELNPFRWIILLGLISSVIMEALDSTIINVALPRMGGNLGATPNEIAWVSTGYILSVVVIVPLTAWLAARFGRKRYLVSSITLFTVASLFCGLSHNLGELIFWRVIQGVGGGALLSTAQATMLEIFPPKDQGMVQGIFGLGVVVAPAVAPLLGGWLTDNYDWRWVFFVNLPIGIGAALLIATYLKDSKFHNKSADAVDWLGIGLLACGLASLQYVLEEGQLDDWFSSDLILRLAIFASICLIGLVVWELSPRNHKPAIDLRVLGDRNLLGGAALAAAMGFGLLGGLFIFPLFVQGILHFTPTQTGLVLLPAGIAILLGIAFCGGAIQNGADPRVLILIGIALFIAANWQLGHLNPQTDAGGTILGQVLRGVGIGFLFIPVSVSAYATLKGAQIAQGTALWNLSLQMGGSIGIAVLNTYVVNMAQFHRSTLVAYLFNGSWETEARQSQLAASLMSNGYGAAQAKAGALALMDQTIQVQSTTMAYNDAFLLIAFAFVFVIPFVFLLKKPAHGAAPVSMH